MSNSTEAPPFEKHARNMFSLWADFYLPIRSPKSDDVVYNIASFDLLDQKRVQGRRADDLICALSVAVLAKNLEAFVMGCKIESCSNQPQIVQSLAFAFPLSALQQSFT